MKLELRRTHSFIEIKVDEIETIIFKNSDHEITEMIYNVTDLLKQLYDMQGLDVEVRTQKK
tara:strand:- start:341 stop:523 length:183 start_codon:yes stop_codon:yes gene_type:complete